MFGTLWYNEIIVLPFLGFDENTKKAIAARSAAEERGLLDGKSDDGNDYMATSPHAAYDANRMKRAITAHKSHTHDDINQTSHS